MVQVSAEIFWEKVKNDSADGCWPWPDRLLPNGYGQCQVRRDGKSVTVLVHRLAYELAVGPIPKGLVIDHECHNVDKSCPGGFNCEHRRCVRPNHLQARTQKQNLRRGIGPGPGGEFHRRKTHCPQGHPYEGGNLRTDARGRRHCRECARDRFNATAAKQRAENPPLPRVPKSHCKHGHEFTPENTYEQPAGVRNCRECKRRQVERYRSRVKTPTHRVDVCKNGHAMDEANSAFAADGTRSCRACSRERTRAYRSSRPQTDRGLLPAQRAACPQGHLYDEVNTYVTSAGHRQCRTCNKARELARTEKRRAAKAAS